MLLKRKKTPGAYDASGKTPVIRVSICTGERTAGFRDPATGKFDELTLIRNDADLAEFCRQYGVKANEIKREW